MGNLPTPKESVLQGLFKANLSKRLNYIPLRTFIWAFARIKLGEAYYICTTYARTQKHSYVHKYT